MAKKEFVNPNNSVGHIEKNDIRPIPLNEREGSPKSLTPMWIGSNTNYVVFLNGVLVVSLGLSFVESILAVLIGNLLGCAVLGMASIMGPRTGTSGIATSRAPFGAAGAYIPIIVSTISVLGWFSINSIVATEGLMELFKLSGLGDIPGLLWICLFAVLALEIILALYGHATILAAEKWLAIILAVVFIGMLFFAIPMMDWSWPNTVDVSLGTSKPGMWLIAMGIIFSYPISWTNFASDYSRYLPPETSWKKIAVCAGGGQFIALTFAEIVGVLFAVALGGSMDDPISQLAGVLPTWYLVPFLIVVMLGCVATNVPNGYTASLGLIAMRLPLDRVKSVFVIAACTLVFRIATLLYGQFFELYQSWLTYIIIWSCPWVAIVVVDYFMRRGNYDGQSLMTWGSKGIYWYKGGIFWAGLIAWIAGVVISILFTNSTLYVSPLVMNFLGGADISFEVGCISGGLIYWLLARNHPTFKEARNLTIE